MMHKNQDSRLFVTHCSEIPPPGFGPAGTPLCRSLNLGCKRSVLGSRCTVGRTTAQGTCSFHPRVLRQEMEFQLSTNGKSTSVRQAQPSPEQDPSMSKPEPELTVRSRYPYRRRCFLLLFGASGKPQGRLLPFHPIPPNRGKNDLYQFSVFVRSGFPDVMTEAALS